MDKYTNKDRIFALSIIAIVAIIAYLPIFKQPFISDDYPNIELSLIYGPVSGWKSMFSDPNWRVRATSVIHSYVVYSLFGLKPWAFYASGLILHILNSWLILAAGLWRNIGFRISFWAAAFFAIYEGHQEAVMWHAANNELLVFFFGFLSFIFWLNFIEKENLSIISIILSLGSYLLALISKESAVIFIPLFTLPLLFPQLRLRRILYLLPYIILTLVYVILIFSSRSQARFENQSFVLSAPFWITWTWSYFVILWFWGLASIILLIWMKEHLRLLIMSLLWIGFSFVPYMFLDYMHRIPSRQLYIASAGLAWIVGAAIVATMNRFSQSYPKIITALLIVIALYNIGYLWIKKYPQFMVRAKPTEELINLARNTPGKIYIKCFYLGRGYAESAVKLSLNKPADTLIWNEVDARNYPQAPVFCYPHE